MESDPFIIETWTRKNGTVELIYSNGKEAFIETWNFPEPKNVEAMEKAIPLLHVLAGVSYWKTLAQKHIRIQYPINEITLQAASQIYDHGMREFAVRNNIEIPLRQTFTCPEISETSLVENKKPVSAIIPFGGGKDSTYVASQYPDAQLVVVNPTKHHLNVAEALNRTVVNISRTLPVNQLTNPNYLNGHVPVTAIISAACVVYAASQNITDVIMSNEQATSESTGVFNGHEANHQWSKSWEAEIILQNLFAAHANYYSVLRDVNERAITENLPINVLPHIVSCNKAFQGSTTGGKENGIKWCGSCPKCLFTFLILAATHNKKTVINMFGKNMFETETEQTWSSLWDDVKPWECTGERSEVKEAFHDLIGTPWENQLVKNINKTLEALIF